MVNKNSPWYLEDDSIDQHRKVEDKKTLKLDQWIIQTNNIDDQETLKLKKMELDEFYDSEENFSGGGLLQILGKPKQPKNSQTKDEKARDYILGEIKEDDRFEIDDEVPIGYFRVWEKEDSFIEIKI